MPRPCRATKGFECVFPIWFTQCGRVWFTLAMPCPCPAYAMLWPCRSSQGHSTARPSRDGLWATWPRSVSSGYHAEFHEDCYQKHTNPPHNDPYLRLWRVVVAHYKKDALKCWTSNSGISGYHADFHEGYGNVGAGQGAALDVWINGTAWQGNGMGTACYVWIGLYPERGFPCFGASVTLIQRQVMTALVSRCFQANAGARARTMSTAFHVLSNSLYSKQPTIWCYIYIYIYIYIA